MFIENKEITIDVEMNLKYAWISNPVYMLVQRCRDPRTGASLYSFVSL